MWRSFFFSEHINLNLLIADDDVLVACLDTPAPRKLDTPLRPEVFR